MTSPNERKVAELGCKTLHYDVNRASVCLLLNPKHRVLARGITFWNPADEYRRKFGADRALGMALQALKPTNGRVRECDLGIRPELLERHGFEPDGINGKERYWYITQHGQTKPQLTILERKLVKRFSGRRNVCGAV